MSEFNRDNKTRIDEYITTNDCEENDSIPVNLKGEKKRLQVTLSKFPKSNFTRGQQLLTNVEKTGQKTNVF